MGTHKRYADMTPDEYIDCVMAMVGEREPVDHPFFDRLERGEYSREQVQKMAYQMLFWFNHAVRNIGASLMHHMPQGARESIMENLIDEETEDRCGHAAHYVLAQEFAEACGYDRDEVEAFNTHNRLRAHPKLEEAFEDIARFGIKEEGALAMAAGMVGGESTLPAFYTRLYPPLIKYYGFTEEELAIFIIHIEGDTEHMEEGKSLVRRFCKTQEQRERFMETARFVRDRGWETWDAVWEAMELDLPQDVYPRHAMFASRERQKAA